MQAAFFDLDKTIISRSSSLALSRPMYRAGMVSRSAMLRGAYAQLVYLLVGADEKKMDRMKESMLAMTKGWDRAEVERLVRDVLIDVIDPYVYQEALDLMELHRSEGRRIYIVSSSPEEVVRPLASHFGVAGVLATRAEIDEHGRYTGELEFYCYGEGKAQAVREVAERAQLDLGGSYAYTDSITDLPMLEVVGNPDRRQSRPRAAQDRRGARLADPGLPPPGSAPLAHRAVGSRPGAVHRRGPGHRRGRCAARVGGPSLARLAARLLGLGHRAGHIAFAPPRPPGYGRCATFAWPRREQKPTRVLPREACSGPAQRYPSSCRQRMIAAPFAHVSAPERVVRSPRVASRDACRPAGCADTRSGCRPGSGNRRPTRTPSAA